MYYKIINDRTVFSECKVIELNDTWISNPSEEQIAEAGWQVYVPPVIPEEAKTKPGMAEVVTAVKKMLSSSIENLTDEEALEVAALYETWISKVGQQVSAGERLWYNEKLYKVLQPHTVQSDWTPDVSTSLFVEVTIEEWPPIPENIPAEAPWMRGDKGTWKENRYICQMDNCVWNPDVLPSAWELVSA